MHKFYSDETIDEVLSANDIVDVVSSYVKLEKKGKYFFGLCPFHREKTASFSVTPSKQICYCYSCQKGGNAIHFIMNVENLAFVEAIKYLADRAGISLPEVSGGLDEEKMKQKKELIQLNTEAARFFHRQLWEKSGEEALGYLRRRALSDSTIKKFGIGYASKFGDFLIQHLLKLKFTEGALKRSGLVLEDSKGKIYERFRGRVMFPIFDLRGNVVAFGGRVLDNSMPKYMNSPETPVYQKGRNLYALNFVRKTGEKKIIVAEGYMDVVSLHQNGIVNTVASLGTALTEEQGKLLRMYGEEVIISFDSDLAGQKAAMRGLDILDELGCNVKVLQIPEGKDPDEFIKKYGEDTFRKILQKSMTLLEYKVSILKTKINVSDTAGKVEFLNKTAEVLGKVDNNIEREMYMKKLSAEYGIREDTLEKEVLKKMELLGKKEIPIKLKKEVPENIPSPGKKEVSNVALYEKILILLLIIDNGIFKQVKDGISENTFSTQREKDLYRIVAGRLEEGRTITTAELLSNLDEEDVVEYVKVIEKELVFENNLRAFLDILKKVQSERIQERQQEILNLLKRNDLQDETTLEELKRELSEIISRKKH